MADTKGVAVIGPETVLQGEIRNGRAVRVDGYVEGRINAAHVEVAGGGKVDGVIRANTADVGGAIDGTVRVRELVQIRDKGRVTGNVQYGALAMAPGGELSADVRNVPPELVGDLELDVLRGGSVIIRRDDLAAIDPDDGPEDLLFVVTNPSSGFVAKASAPTHAVTRFTQADLNAGRVMFVHDGAPGARASFAVTVQDDDGATAGAARTVSVNVTDAPAASA
ncbi:MAG: polymer-forming cytoskeletal protein [Pseudomonadota bacterium]